MERGALEVSEGSEVVNKALNALSGIVSSVSEATIRMLEITKAAQEQKGISSEMVTIIEQVAAVAEETAAGAEEASAATEEQTASMEELTASAQELAKLANDLQEIVNSFKIDGVKTDLEAKELSCTPGLNPTGQVQESAHPSPTFARYSTKPGVSINFPSYTT